MTRTHVYSLTWSGDAFMPGEEHKWWFSNGMYPGSAAFFSVNAHPYGGLGELRHVELKVTDMSSAAEYDPNAYDPRRHHNIYFTVVNMGPDPEVLYRVTILWVADE